MRLLAPVSRGRVTSLVGHFAERVQDHRPAGIEVDPVGVESRVPSLIRIPAVNFECLNPLGAGRRQKDPSTAHLGASGQREHSHDLDVLGADALLVHARGRWKEFDLVGQRE
jgi:hypothetical protein